MKPKERTRQGLFSPCKQNGLMESILTPNAVSKSLLAREVYGVCFTRRDSPELFCGEFSTARKKFFTGGKKTVKVGQKEAIKGFEGKLQGKLARRCLYWKKTANKVNLEEAFGQRGGFLLVLRDFRNIITARLFFDKDQMWLKSEYYDPWDSRVASVIFKPCGAFDGVERFDYMREQKQYRSTILYPVDYRPGTAEQSLVNSRFGEPELILSTEQGSFCYCPKGEASDREEALKEIQSGSILLTSAWEVKDGALHSEAEEAGPIFSTLEEVAVLPESGAEQKAPEPSETPVEEGEKEAPETQDATEEEASTKPLISEDEPEAPAASLEEEAAEPIEESASVQEETAPDNTAIGDPEIEALLEAARLIERQPEQPSAPRGILDAQAILQAAQRLAQTEKPLSSVPEEAVLEEEETPEKESEKEAASIEETSSPEEPASLEGSPLTEETAEEASPAVEAELSRQTEPAITGRKRTQQSNGLTAYDGEYKDGKRDGFGSYYYQNGNLCYAGFWKDGQKDGLGVSFRNSDQALHIARWKEGKSDGFTALFDREGDLRYAGRMEGGKKQGAGVTYHREDGTLFVGSWENDLPTGLGSLFDPEGRLLYTGMWQDGKQNGHGTEFDENGDVVFSGEWKDGKYHNGILYKKQDPPTDGD